MHVPTAITVKPKARVVELTWPDGAQHALPFEYLRVHSPSAEVRGHGGGEGKRTWTGLAFQVPDVVSGAKEVVAAGGLLSREPEPENGEPAHLAMCVDPEGNEFMLTRKRSQ